MAQNRFTPEERQAILDHLLAELQTDERIAGVLIIGSGAVGFADDYSDIDLSVVVSEEVDVARVFKDCQRRVWELYSVLRGFEVQYTPTSFLMGVLLSNYLEIDIGVLGLATLEARHARWRVAFDRSGQIEAIQQRTWANRREPDQRAIYLHYLDGVWHYTLHVDVAIRRGQLWRAICDLEELRSQTVHLAGLRLGLDTKRFRQADQLPQPFRETLAATLIRQADDPAEIRRALRAVVDCFFSEARAMDARLGLDESEQLYRALIEYLA